MTEIDWICCTGMGERMKIEAGKRYKTRCGELATVTKRVNRSNAYPWDGFITGGGGRDTKLCWSEVGRYWGTSVESSYDLIAPADDPPIWEAGQQGDRFVVVEDGTAPGTEDKALKTAWAQSELEQKIRRQVRELNKMRERVETFFLAVAVVALMTACLFVADMMLTAKGY